MGQMTDAMDMITHVALGAIVGELTLGKQAGNRAVLWGALVGLVPELDRLLRWTHGDWAYLLYGQSLTHSLLFVLLGGLLLGRLFYRLHGRRVGTRRGWVRLWFWGLLTHVLLDCCSTWGTQLFFPFWSYRVAGNFIAEIDPFFTLPLLLGLLLGLRHARDTRPRNLWVGMGLVLSSLYLLVTITNQQYVRAVFDHTFEQADSRVLRMGVYPALGSNLLWHGVAEMPYGYQVAYFSVFEGASTTLDVHYVPKRHSLPDSLINLSQVQTLRRVSDRYYVVSTRGDSVLWHDLRFGLGSVLSSAWTAPAFQCTFLLTPSDQAGHPNVRIERPQQGLSAEGLRLTWQRILGKSPSRPSESRPISDQSDAHN